MKLVQFHPAMQEVGDLVGILQELKGMQYRPHAARVEYSPLTSEPDSDIELFMSRAANLSLPVPVTMYLTLASPNQRGPDWANKRLGSDTLYDITIKLPDRFVDCIPHGDQFEEILKPFRTRGWTISDAQVD